MMSKKDNRFVVTYKQGGFVDPGIKILVDRKTGVNYMWTESGYAGGLTPLLNQDGSVVITPVPSDYNE